MKTQMSSRMIAVDDLLVDRSYQRPVNEKAAREIAETFLSESMAVVSVGERRDGSLYIVDGQHRVAAARILGLTHVLCIVFQSDGPAHEALVFCTSNAGRKSVKPIGLHNAALVQGNEQAVSIASILAKYGLRISEGAGWPCIQAVAKVKSIYVRENGPEILDRALSVIVRAWEGDAAALTKFSIGGVALAIRRAPEIDDDRLVRKLAPVSFMSVLRASDVFYGGAGIPGGNARESCVANVILNIYAKGLRKPKK